MRIFFRDKPMPIWPKQAATDSSVTVNVIRIENFREWLEFCGELRPAATGGPQTPAEINARAAELWPKPKPLVPVWKQKSLAEGKR